MLGGVVTTLTLVQYRFMRGLGWHPLYAPTLDWPSGLALGPYGAVMIVTFVVSGCLLIVFAIGLHAVLGQPSRNAARLLVVAGIAMALLAFKVDPTFRTTPRTWHGALHDASFVLLGCSLLPAMFLLWRCFKRDSRWHNHARYTIATTALLVPAFWLKGLGFYLFLIAVLTWIAIIAVRLWRIASNHPHEPRSPLTEA